MESVVNGEERKPLTDHGNSPVTGLLLFSIFIPVCASFAYGCAMGYTSPVESQLKDELHLSTAEFSLFGSMLSVGGLSGSLMSGKIADLIGRRGAMGLSATLSVLGWIAISISEKAWSLDLGRFLVGGGVGITLYVVPIYIAEITPKNLRGGFVSATQLMISCGTLVMFFVGSLISWRLLVLIGKNHILKTYARTEITEKLMFITGIIPSVIQLMGLFYIPESPRFLVCNPNLRVLQAKVVKNEAHEKALQRLRGYNTDVSQEAADIQELTERLQETAEVKLLGLFKRKYAHALTVVVGLMVLGGLGGTIGLTCYASSVFEAAGFSSSIGSTGMAIIQLPSTALGIYLVDRLGRRLLLVISAAAMSLCCILVGIMFLVKQSGCLGQVTPYLIVAGLWGYAAAYPIGLATIPFVIMSEIFPMDAKGAAGSLSTVVCGIMAWVSQYAFNFVTGWSYSGTFFIYVGLNAVTILFVAKLVPETKGKTLEEIQQRISLH